VKEYVIKLNLNSNAFADSIFEIDNGTSNYLMNIYSLWVETNALYRVVDTIIEIYGMDDVYGEKYFMNFEIEHESIIFKKMYKFYFGFILS